MDDDQLKEYLEEIEQALGCTDGDDIRDHMKPIILEMRTILNKQTEI